MHKGTAKAKKGLQDTSFLYLRRTKMLKQRHQPPGPVKTEPFVYVDDSFDQYSQSNGFAKPNGTTSSRSKRLSLFVSILWVVFCIIIAISVGIRLHYRLPAPKDHNGFNPVTNVPEFSERNAMAIIQWLSGRIGYRILYFSRYIMKNEFWLGNKDMAIVRRLACWQVGLSD